MIFEVGGLYIIFIVAPRFSGPFDLDFCEKNKLFDVKKFLEIFPDYQIVGEIDFVGHNLYKKKKCIPEYFNTMEPFFIMENDQENGKILVMQTVDGDSKIGRVNYQIISEKHMDMIPYKNIVCKLM